MTVPQFAFLVRRALWDRAGQGRLGAPLGNPMGKNKGLLSEPFPC
jgi:hypothetical protein